MYKIHNYQGHWIGKTMPEPLQKLRDKGFEIVGQSHAWAILTVDFKEALGELEEVLNALTIPIEEIVGSGGGETKGTQRLRKALATKNWKKAIFKIEKTINDIPRESISHEVDHVRSFPDNKLIALEIEWNNKDPFFDRDLENFKRLHAEGAISVGIIVTRGSSLQNNMRALIGRFAEEKQIASFDDLAKLLVVPTPKQRIAVAKRVERGLISFRDAWVDNFVSNKFGAATTHWKKLEDRVHRGVGNPCPLVLIGLPDSIVTFDQTEEYMKQLVEVEEEEEAAAQEA